MSPVHLVCTYLIMCHSYATLFIQGCHHVYLCSSVSLTRLCEPFCVWHESSGQLVYSRNYVLLALWFSNHSSLLIIIIFLSMEKFGMCPGLLFVHDKRPFIYSSYQCMTFLCFFFMWCNFVFSDERWEFAFSVGSQLSRSFCTIFRSCDPLHLSLPPKPLFTLSVESQLKQNGAL